MKKYIILSILFISFITFNTLFSQTTTEKFKVYGNCKMCKKKIDKAANGVEGVSLANWNVDTKIIEVSYDKSKTNAEDIHKAIANVGYDTELETASDEVYDNLPSCCQYDRKEEEAIEEEAIEEDDDETENIPD